MIRKNFFFCDVLPEDLAGFIDLFEANRIIGHEWLTWGENSRDCPAALGDTVSRKEG